MRRLIDEDDVKNWLQERIDAYKQLLEIIKEELAIRVPTAYYPHKVEKQLDHRGLERAEKIVKGGEADDKSI